MHKLVAVTSVVLGLALAPACASESGWEAPTQSRTLFKEEVLPVLIRDCGFHACHGAEGRFFRIWGAGRVRLNSATNALSESTEEEVTASHQRALSMIDTKDPAASLLLTKPLAVEAGGAGHLGADRFGRNVYRTVDDPGYLVLSRWVFSTMQP